MQSALCECNIQCSSDLLKELEGRTKTAKDKSEVAYKIFVVLHTKLFITPHDPAVLKVMITRCIPDSEKAQQLFSEYEIKLEKYLSNRISDNPSFQNFPMKIPECTSKTLYVRTDDTWNENTSQRQLYYLERIVSGIFRKKIRLKLVSPGGSLVICFEVPMNSSLAFDFGENKDTLKLLNAGVCFLKQECAQDMYKTCKYLILQYC